MDRFIPLRAPLFVFQADGFVLVTQDVAVASIAIGDFFIAALAKGTFGRGVLQRLDEIRVIGVLAIEVFEEILRPSGIAGRHQGLSEPEGRFLVSRRVAVSDFERQNRRLGKLTEHGRLSQGFVSQNAAGIMGQDGLQLVEGIHRIRAQGDLGLGQSGGGACGAKYLLQKPRLPVLALDLGRPEHFTSIIASGLLLEDVFKQGNGVIQVISVEGLTSFLVLLAQRAGKGVGFRLAHQFLIDWFVPLLKKKQIPNHLR